MQHTVGHSGENTEGWTVPIADEGDKQHGKQGDGPAHGHMPELDEGCDEGEGDGHRCEGKLPGVDALLTVRQHRGQDEDEEYDDGRSHIAPDGEGVAAVTIGYDEKI